MCCEQLLNRELPLPGVNRKLVTGSQAIDQFQFYIEDFDRLTELNLEGLLFRSERLKSGISDDSQLFVRTEHHNRTQGVRALRHVNALSLVNLLPIA